MPIRSRRVFALLVSATALSLPLAAQNASAPGRPPPEDIRWAVQAENRQKRGEALSAADQERLARIQTALRAATGSNRPATKSAAASAQTPAKAPTPVAPKAQAAPPATTLNPSGPNLSAVTSAATNWDEFFAASARRGTARVPAHQNDVTLFHRRHPADAEQLRAAYRRTQAALRPTPGTNQGLERGALFVAYVLALQAAGLDNAAAAAASRDDYLNLARTDIYAAYEGILWAPRVIAWRSLLTPEQTARIDEIGRMIAQRQPLPKVPGTAPAPSAVAAASTAAKAAPAPSAPAVSASEQILKTYEDLRVRISMIEADANAPAFAQTLTTVAGLIPRARQVFVNQLEAIVLAFEAKLPANDLARQGSRAFSANNRAEAVRLWEQAAAQGHTGAMLYLAVHRNGPPAQSARPGDPDAYRDLLLRAVEAGQPNAFTYLARYHLLAGPGQDFAKAGDYARKAVAAGDYHAGYEHYRSAHLLNATPNPSQLHAGPRLSRTTIDAAVQDLARAALHGHAASMYLLGTYHLSGHLPGSRTTTLYRFSPELIAFNLPLARFWLQQASGLPDGLTAQGRESVARNLAMAEQALALAKGREWTADEVIAALGSGLNHDVLALLVTREGARFTQAEQARIFASAAGSALAKNSMIDLQIRVHTHRPPFELAATAVAERRRTVSPLPSNQGNDLDALRRGFEAGDPAAAYALLQLLPHQHSGNWPEDGPPRPRVIEVALSRDYGPAQYLRSGLEQLANHPDTAKRDLPRSFALLLASARAGSAEAARLVADAYRGGGGRAVYVRPNHAEAEWWYAQAAALAWPGQFKSTGDILEPERNLAHLYQFESAGLGMGIGFNARDPATLRWVRELRRRGGMAKTLADERVTRWASPDSGNQNIEPLVAALPPELPPFAPDELARLEREAAAGQPEALRTLARALAYGEGGLRQDDARAVELYRRAAEAGDREAMTALADHLHHGYGAKRDLVAALSWRDRAEGRTRNRIELLVEAAQQASFKREDHAFVELLLREAIALGSAEAKRALGGYLIEGRIVTKDVAAGLRLMEEAAEAGDVRAMTGLGLYYRQGTVVPADLPTAHRWRVRAAEAGDMSSINALVDDFDRGRNGAPQDAREALRWARLAAPEADAIRRNLPRLEREVATLDRNPGMTTAQLRTERIVREVQLHTAALLAASPDEPGADAFARAASLEGEARLAALREAAGAGHVAAHLRLIDLLVAAGRWHEAHWWTLRPAVSEHEEGASLRSSIEARRAFNILGLKSSPGDSGGGAVLEEFTAERDKPLEKAMPELDELLARAGPDRTRLIEQLDRLIDRSAGRAEPLIAKAQLVIDKEPGPARDLLERAVALEPLHPQAQALLARLEARSGQPHRAYYRLGEVARARPNSLLIARARADLLVALGGSPRECADLRGQLQYILKNEPDDTARFGGLMSSLKLAETARDREAYLADLNAAIALQPSPQFILQRAQLSEQNKDFPRALSDYEQLLAGPAGKNPQQAAQLRARIETVQKAMNAEAAARLKALENESP